MIMSDKTEEKSEEVRQCSKCNAKYPATTEFFKLSKKWLGRTCRPCLRKDKKEWHKNNPEHVKKYKREYYHKNKEQELAACKRYYQKNKDIIIKRVYKHKKRRLQHDPIFRITENLRRRLNHALAGTSKSQETMELLGCSPEELKQYLEQQFQDGMTFENYGEWQIDHIKPCSKFDLSQPKQQRECFHYSNLQPLWKRDNLRKSNKYD